MRIHRSEERGFTLMELLAVIAIILIIVTALIVSVSTVRKHSRDTQRVSDIKQLQLAIRAYRDIKATSSFPFNKSTILNAGVTIGEGGVLDSTLSTYLAGSLKDPLGDSSDTSYEYVYRESVSCGSTSKTLVYAKSMELPNSSNWSEVCPGGTAPGTNTYGVSF